MTIQQCKYVLEIAKTGSFSEAAKQLFILSYINRKHFEGMKERIEKINNVFDAIGLSAFSVRGQKSHLKRAFTEILFWLFLWV